MRTLILALMFAVGAASAQEKSLLRYKHKAGDKRTYLTEQKMTMKMTINGMDIETKVDQAIEMIWEVKMVDAKGGAAMVMQIGRVTLTLDTFGGSYEADSAKLKDTKDPVGKILNQAVEVLAAARITFSRNALGEISEVEIPDEIVKKLDAIPEGAAGLSADAVRAMAQGGIVFPEAVAKGDSWNQRLKIDLPFGKADSDIKYTYDGSEQRGDRKADKFSYVPMLKIEPDMNAKVKIAVKKSEGKGIAYFDNVSGKLLEQTMELTMRMEVETMGMTFTQDVVQNTTIRLKE